MPGPLKQQEETQGMEISHLDVRRERAVSEAIKGTHITRIIVAHRPETIRSADRVIALDQGKVVKDPQLLADEPGQPWSIKGFLGS